MNRYGIAIHGGAQDLDRAAVSAAQEAEYIKGLQQALLAAYFVLEKGWSAIEAVEIAVKSLEDNPNFNAGKGSVFTHDGKIEMDASIMCGKTRKAGAVAGVMHIKNPVTLARAVMDQSPFVLLTRDKAEAFAREVSAKEPNINIEFVGEEYFFTQHRYDELMEELEKIKESTGLREQQRAKFGTVGAVALDQHGNLAAATSTGGLTNKNYGRVADSAIIGAGTYANNATCAISCTGDGENMIRSVTAYDISCLMEYKGLSLQEACRIVVQEKMPTLEGNGGLIGIDSKGNISMEFITTAMFRGMKTSDGDLMTGIFK